MPIMAVDVFTPPEWWGDLTDSQRQTVKARLNKMGYAVQAWPTYVR